MKLRNTVFLCLKGCSMSLRKSNTTTKSSQTVKKDTWLSSENSILRVLLHTAYAICTMLCPHPFDLQQIYFHFFPFPGLWLEGRMALIKNYRKSKWEQGQEWVARFYFWASLLFSSVSAPTSATFYETFKMRKGYFMTPSTFNVGFHYLPLDML